MSELRSSQRKWLRGMAHPLEPIVRLGKHGATESVLAEIDAALDVHELIKVQAPIPREEKGELAAHLEAELNAQVVGRIGHIFILYREQPDPEKRTLELPA